MRLRWVARYLGASELHRLVKHDNVNVHRAAANILQAEKAARPADPCATYCYPSIKLGFVLSEPKFDYLDYDNA